MSLVNSTYYLKGYTQNIYFESSCILLIFKILLFHNDILIQIDITPSETKQYHHKSINFLFNFSGEKEKHSVFSHVSKFCCEFRQLFPSKRKYPIKGITFETTKTYSTKNN